MEYLPRASLCTYVARSIPHVCTGVRVALLIVTTTCDFKRGGATKPIIGSSWNNAVKTAWTCIRYRNVLVWLCWLFFVDYDVCKRLCNPAWSIFQYFFCTWMLHGYSTIFVNFDGKRNSHDQTDADDLHDYLCTMIVSAVYSQKSKLHARLHLANAVWQMQSGHWCKLVCWSNALMRYSQFICAG